MWTLRVVAVCTTLVLAACSHADRPDLEHVARQREGPRFLSHSELREKVGIIERFGLARNPTLDLASFDGEVLSWIEGDAEIRAVSEAVKAGSFVPDDGLSSASVWQLGFEFRDGSSGWVELVAMGPEQDGYITFQDSSRGVLILGPDLRHVIARTYGWDTWNDVLNGR